MNLRKPEPNSCWVAIEGWRFAVLAEEHCHADLVPIVYSYEEKEKRLYSTSSPEKVIASQLIIEWVDRHDTNYFHEYVKTESLFDNVLEWLKED